MSTLEVLAFGMAALSRVRGRAGRICGLTCLAHTSNRIDVELGARLFRHLFALPMAYFQVRRVGDTIARVRELDNIRQFLTSSALTLAIDLFFSLHLPRRPVHLQPDADPRSSPAALPLLRRAEPSA